MPRKWHIDGENDDGLQKVGYCSEENRWTFRCPRTGHLFVGDSDDGGNLTRVSAANSRPRESPTPQPRAAPTSQPRAAPAPQPRAAPWDPENYNQVLQQGLRQNTVAGCATYTCPITGQVYDRRTTVPAEAPISQQRSLPLVPYQEPPPPVPHHYPLPPVPPHHPLPPTPSGDSLAPRRSRPLPLRIWTSPDTTQPPPAPHRPALRHAVTSPPFRSRIPVPVRPATPVPQVSRPPLVLSPVLMPVSTSQQSVPTNHQSVSTDQQSVTMQFYGQPINDVAAPPVTYYPGMYYIPVVGQGQGPGHLSYPAREPAPQPPPPQPAPQPAAAPAARRRKRKRSLLQLCIDALLKRHPGDRGG